MTAGAATSESHRVATYAAPGAAQLRLVKARPEDCQVLIYHANCTDGLAAAWCASQKRERKVKLVPVNHPLNKDQRKKIAKKAKNKHVVVVDFSFNKEETEWMIRHTKSFVVLDHHHSAFEDLKNIEPYYKVLTKDMSGATLAWCYFFPNEPVPPLLRYIEDTDLWRWTQPNSKEFGAAVDMKIKKVDHITDLINKGQRAIDNIIADGKILMKHINNMVNYYIAIMHKCQVEGFSQWTGAVINCSTLRSHVGFISQGIFDAVPDIHYAVVWYYDYAGGLVRASLRSRSIEVDVSKIAKVFNGGGHQQAASFQCGWHRFRKYFKLGQVAEGSHRVTTGQRPSGESLPEGEIGQEYAKYLVDRHVANHYKCRIEKFPDFKGVLVNSSTQIDHIGREICNRLRNVDFVAVWYHDGQRDQIKVSLYSASGVDVSRLSKTWGGVGNNSTAGFSCSCKQLYKVFKHR